MRITKRCKSCKYHKYLANVSCWCCHYAIDTDKLRDCDPKDCTKWKSKTGERKERVDIHLLKEPDKI